jgi:hypothetical protein
MAEVLSAEQLEELGVILKGTDNDLSDALEELGISLRPEFHSEVEEQLAEIEQLEQCALCGVWTFTESFQCTEEGDMVCANCFYRNSDDEEEFLHDR